MNSITIHGTVINGGGAGLGQIFIQWWKGAINEPVNWVPVVNPTQTDESGGYELTYPNPDGDSFQSVVLAIPVIVGGYESAKAAQAVSPGQRIWWILHCQVLVKGREP